MAYCNRIISDTYVYYKLEPQSSTNVEPPSLHPTQVDVGEQHIVVSDTGNNRVQVLRYIGDELHPLHVDGDIGDEVKRAVESKSVLGRKLNEADLPGLQKNGWTRKYMRRAANLGVPLPVEEKYGEEKDEDDDDEGESDE